MGSCVAVAAVGSCVAVAAVGSCVAVAAVGSCVAVAAVGSCVAAVTTGMLAVAAVGSCVAVAVCLFFSSVTSCTHKAEPNSVLVNYVNMNIINIVTTVMLSLLQTNSLI